MGNTVCKKCGINHSYYKPYIMNYGILNDRNNCRYHSNVQDKICKRCSKNVLHEIKNKAKYDFNILDIRSFQLEEI